MNSYANWPTEGKILTIEFTRCILVLSEAEMLKLLSHEPEIWASSLKLMRRKKDERPN